MQGAYSYWWSWSWRRWRNHCLETECLSLGGPSARPLQPPLRCQHGHPCPPHSRSNCWRLSWHSGCDRAGFLNRVERNCLVNVCVFASVSSSSSVHFTLCLHSVPLTSESVCSFVSSSILPFILPSPPSTIYLSPSTHTHRFWRGSQAAGVEWWSRAA